MVGSKFTDCKSIPYIEYTVPPVPCIPLTRRYAIPLDGLQLTYDPNEDEQHKKWMDRWMNSQFCFVLFFTLLF